jgi:hypothetical protein
MLTHTNAMGGPNPAVRAQMPESFSTLPASAERSGFEHILTSPAFAEIEAYPHTGAFGRSYHPAIHGDHDCSFVILSGDRPVLVCLCSSFNGKLDFYGLPLRLFACHGLSDTICRAAVKAAFIHLDALAAAHGARELLLREPAAPLLSSIGEAALARHALATFDLVAQVDLTAGLQAWRRALRKSFRSCVNWGRRNLVVTFVNQTNPDVELFDRFRMFHAEVAGRVTRPKQSWDIMYDWVAAGRGELIAASLEGRLAAASLFIDGTDTSIYMTGVYDRALFDKPLGHYPLWLGIERAQARGMRTLELGDLPFESVANDKEFRIGYFKRGFATHIDTNIVWRWSSAAVDPK